MCLRACKNIHVPAEARGVEPLELEVAATANHHVSAVKGAWPVPEGDSVSSELLAVSLLQSANKPVEFRCGWLPSSVCLERSSHWVVLKVGKADWGSLTLDPTNFSLFSF